MQAERHELVGHGGEAAQVGLLAPEEELVEAVHREQVERYELVGHGGEAEQVGAVAVEEDLVEPNHQVQVERHVGAVAAEEDLVEARPVAAVAEEDHHVGGHLRGTNVDLWSRSAPKAERGGSRSLGTTNGKAKKRPKQHRHQERQ